jgi:hypothetical protein
VFAWYVGAWCAVDCRFPSFGFVVEREGWLGIGCVEARWCVWCGCAVANLQAICQMAQQPVMTRHVVQRICGLRCRHERMYAELTFVLLELLRGSSETGSEVLRFSPLPQLVRAIVPLIHH